MKSLLAKTLGGIIRKVFGDNTYKNIRANYLFNDLSDPFPLYPKTDFKLDLTANVNNGEFGELVYIVSPMQRSGTNYLVTLLNLHPDLQWVSDDKIPSEVCLYSYSDELKNYCYKTVSKWAKWIGGDEKLCNHHVSQMMANMGEGVLQHIKTFVDKGKIPLFKTPDSLGLSNIHLLFPKAKVVILNRDGRDTVESLSKSWGQNLAFKKMCKRWSNRVDEILKFKKYSKDAGLDHQYCEVRYEQLNNNTADEIGKILTLLKLDLDKYPWEQINAVPILGSSQFQDGDKVHWKPITKTASFKANANWEQWANWKKRVFKSYAGKSLIQLGFEKGYNW